MQSRDQLPTNFWWMKWKTTIMNCEHFGEMNKNCSCSNRYLLLSSQKGMVSIEIVMGCINNWRQQKLSANHTKRKHCWSTESIKITELPIMRELQLLITLSTSSNWWWIIIQLWCQVFYGPGKLATYLSSLRLSESTIPYMLKSVVSLLLSVSREMQQKNTSSDFLDRFWNSGEFVTHWSQT